MMYSNVLRLSLKIDVHFNFSLRISRERNEGRRPFMIAEGL